MDKRKVLNYNMKFFLVDLVNYILSLSCNLIYKIEIVFQEPRLCYYYFVNKKNVLFCRITKLQ